jgi:colanic acid/amylovoran biosynthesis glycosyltransferase
MIDETKIKIAHFIRGFLPRTETFVMNQINSISNYEVIPFALNRIPEGLQNENINPVIISEILSSYKARFQKIAYKYLRMFLGSSSKIVIDRLYENNIKLLHFHFLVDARFYLKIINNYNVPAVVSGYGWDISTFPKSYYGFGRSYLAPLFKRVKLFFAMTEIMKNDLLQLGCPEEKIVVHYHGINSERFANPSKNYEEKDRLNILFCGRLEQVKNPDLVLKSLKAILDRKLTNKLFNVRIVGDGSLKSTLEFMIKEYGWQDKVTLVGHIPHYSDNLVSEYKNADIFVFPSKTFNNEKEGIPGTIIEAMAAGLPVIGTMHGGIPEIIKSGVSGLLCDQNSEEDFINNIVKVMNNSKLREQLGKTAYTQAMQYDLKIKTQELEEIYSSLLRNSK